MGKCVYIYSPSRLAFFFFSALAVTFLNPWSIAADARVMNSAPQLSSNTPYALRSTGLCLRVTTQQSGRGPFPPPLQVVCGREGAELLHYMLRHYMSDRPVRRDNRCTLK